MKKLKQQKQMRQTIPILILAFLSSVDCNTQQTTGNNNSIILNFEKIKT